MRREDPVHQGTWEAFTAFAIRHFVSPTVRGRIVLVGDALHVWNSMVRLTARSPVINELAKELALHLAPVGHELVGIHVWSKVNVTADALSRVGNEDHASRVASLTQGGFV